jgi:hypothetical protein
VGSGYLYLYYQFLREYHREPVDFEDFFDGVNSFIARIEIENPPREG